MSQEPSCQVFRGRLWTSTEMLHRNKIAFTPQTSSSSSPSSSSFWEGSSSITHATGRTIGAPPPTTAGSAHPSHPTSPAKSIDMSPPSSADPKHPETPRGILGVSSKSGPASSFLDASSANIAQAAMGTQRRVVEAPTQHNAFPSAKTSAGAPRKKKWRPHCQHPTCLRPASYAGCSESEPVFCEKHKTSGQQNVVHPNRGDCEFVGCGRVSAYASTEDTRARFCHLHKDEGMVKVRDRVGTRCEEPTCIKQASFAMEGDRYPKFCKDHRQHDMINIRNQRCIAFGCSRGASFAASGSQRGQFCSVHKSEGMVNTRRRNRCIAPGCNSRDPIYVVDGQQLPKFCTGHRGPGMFLPHPTNRAQCLLPDCSRQLELAAPGEEQRLFCNEHDNGTSDVARPTGPTNSFDGSSCGPHIQRTDIIPKRGNVTVGGISLGIPRREWHTHLEGIVSLGQDRYRSPSHLPVPPGSTAGPPASTPSPTRAWHIASAAPVPQGLLRSGRDGAKEGSIPTTAYCATMQQHREQLQPPSHRSNRPDRKRLGDQLPPAAVNHHGAVEHPALQRSGEHSATSDAVGSWSPLVAFTEAGGFERNSFESVGFERDGVISMDRKGKGKAIQSDQWSFPAYSATRTASAHLGVRAHDEFPIDGTAHPQHSNLKHGMDQPVRVHSRGGRQKEPKPPVLRLLQVEHPTRAAGLERSLSHPGGVTPPPAASETTTATAMNETGVDHEQTVGQGDGEEAFAAAQLGAVRSAEQERCDEAGTTERKKKQKGSAIGIARHTTTTPAAAEEEEEEEKAEKEEETRRSREYAEAPSAINMNNEKLGGSNNRADGTKSKRHNGLSLNDTNPPGYTRTPFYYTLVKALTGKRKRHEVNSASSCEESYSVPV